MKSALYLISMFLVAVMAPYQLNIVSGEEFDQKLDSFSIDSRRLIAIYSSPYEDIKADESGLTLEEKMNIAEDVVKLHGGRVIKKFSLIAGFVFEGDLRIVRTLETLGFKVYPDRVFTIQATPLVWDKKSMVSEEAALRTSIPTIGANILHSQGVIGDGVIVAVIDTGVQNDHPLLIKPNGMSVVAAEYDATGTGINDYCGKGTGLVYFTGYHGTAVAGVIASQSQRLKGVAPGVSIYDVIVFSPDLDCAFALESDIISGIEWAVLGPDGVLGTGDEADIINLSLGSLTPPWSIEKWYEDADLPPILRALKKAVENGVIVTIAAGNFGGGGGLHNVNYLCAVEGIICVGASDDKNTLYPIDDKVALFSSRGPLGLSKLSPHIVAPGVDIETLVPTETGFSVYPLKGTSFSAPHAAGAAALLLSL